MRLINDEDNRIRTEVPLVVFFSINDYLSSLVKYFQENDAIILEAFNKLIEFKGMLNSVGSFILENLDLKMCLEKYGLLRELYILRESLTELMIRPIDKLNKYLQHDCFNFLEMIRIFDPKQKGNLMNSEVFKNQTNQNPIFKLYRVAHNLNNESYDRLLKEFNLYLNSNPNFDNYVSAIEFWNNLKDNLSLLSALVLETLMPPVSNAQVERSFSIYRKVLKPERYSLKEENLEGLLMMYFNKNI